jgi:glutathione S-transferase
MEMENATLIVLLALLQYVWFTARVGQGRGKYKIDAPACAGDEKFERLFRIQQNTMEQLVVFIPTTFAFAYYLSPVWVLVPGIAYLLGRFLYSSEYANDPKTRTPGMALTLVANVVLILGALFGLIKSML